MATVDTQLPAAVGTSSHDNQNGQTRGRGGGRRPHRGRGGGHRQPRNNNQEGSAENTSQANGTESHNTESRGRARRPRPPRKLREPQAAPQPELTNGTNATQASATTPSSTSPTSESFPRQDGRNEGNRGGHRGGRGGGRGRGGRPRSGHNRDSKPTPAQNVGPNGAGPSTASSSESRNGASRVTGPHRKFGGELTTEVQTEKFDEDDMGSDLPEEKPPASKPSAPKRQKAPKDQPKNYKEAEDLMGRIHQEVSSGNYECMICYGGVTRRSKIWDCKVCYAVFHLNCIQKWAEQGVSAETRGEQSGDEPAKMWRCPGCQNKLADVPKAYQCWCGKQKSPEAVKYLPPHSCGQTCGKKRPSPLLCPHACDLQCHAGPCPPCASMGPVQSCFCGKETAQRRCSETAYEDNGWSCGQVCNSLMECGIHRCKKACHIGPCGSCPETEIVRCYCGKDSKVVKCSEKKSPRRSVEIRDDEMVEWEGYYQCVSDCEKSFDCGIHKCQKPCHQQDAVVKHCPFSPDVVRTCPCGKTPLCDLGIEARTKCTDPIPNCTKVCNKKLKCGHTCQQKCHEGDCRYCLRTVEVMCRCGKTFSSSLCTQGDQYEPPMCFRSCRVTLNCQRHECGEKCCPGERAAMERLSQKKKRSRPLGSVNPNTDEGFEPEHICTRICGKLLKCGLHACPMMCHRGPCNSCLEASWEELTCHCGRTAIQPPVRCGTKPPPCTYQCTRPKSCSHPAVPHSCHGDEEKCPHCPYLVDKVCDCGKMTIRAQPCYRTVVSCATKCGRLLSCGSHTCQKSCHKPGDCEEPCQQACGKLRPACGHPCVEKCHAPFACSEDKPCPARLQLTCECGGIKHEAKCGATKTTPGNKKTLKCADQCRARRLALAFEQNPDSEGSAVKGYGDETVAYYKENPKWAAQIEQTLREFIDKPTKRLNFRPMRKPQRGFIHSLAEDFGLISESQDPEPYRSVTVSKPSGRLAIQPRKSIAEFIRTKAATQAAEGTATTSTPSPLISQLKKPQKQPYNAFILNHVRVGILHSELESLIEPALRSSRLIYTVRWIADEDVTLEPKSSSLSADELERDLTHTKPILKQLCAATGIAASVEMCFVINGKLLYKENANQGWNAVGKGAPAQLKPKVFASYNNFSVLSHGGGGMAVPGPSKPKPVEEKKKLVIEVVDDWEAEAEEEERIENEIKAKMEELALSEEERSKGKGRESDSDGHETDDEKGKGKEVDSEGHESDFGKSDSDAFEFHEAIEHQDDQSLAQEEISNSEGVSEQTLEKSSE